MKSATGEVLLIFLCVTALACGVFITKDECPPNEEYLLCGSSCPFNCSSPEGPFSCTDDCAEGCFCKSGYLRDLNGTCVKADECGKNDSICEVNEEFLSCGSACPATCANPEPLVCGVACSVGCFCKAGYVRDEATGKCTTADNCTVEPCPNENEVYNVCSADCEPSCADPEPLCTKVCSGGCVCATGLLRDETGQCVSVEKCPSLNGTDGVFGRYLDMINKIIHLSSD